jgi:hypothetical protein
LGFPAAEGSGAQSAWAPGFAFEVGHGMSRAVAPSQLTGTAASVIGVATTTASL